MSINEIYDLTPRQLANYQIGHAKRRDEEEKAEWMRARYTAIVMLNRKAEKFPWEKGTSDEIKKRIDAVKQNLKLTASDMDKLRADWHKKFEKVKKTQ